MARAFLIHHPERTSYDVYVVREIADDRRLALMPDGSWIVVRPGEELPHALRLTEDVALALMEACRAADDHRDVWRAIADEREASLEIERARVDRILDRVIA